MTRRDPTVDGRSGDWAEIELVVLEPGARAPSLPEDTACVPFVARVKGFLREEARLGEHATVETVLGRAVEGRLRAVLPEVRHSFGRPAPELLPIGGELRSLLASERGRA